MKFKKQHLSITVLCTILVLITCITLTFTFPVNAQTPKDESIAVKQYDGTKQNNKILNSFKQDNRQIKSIESETDLKYPDYYGGSYLNENGELVILLKETSNLIRTNLRTIADNQSLQFESATYSYEELNQMVNQISEYKKANNDRLAEAIDAWALNDKENTIEVYIKNLDDDLISLFKSNVNNSTSFIFKDAGTGFAYTSCQEEKENETSSVLSTLVMRPGMGISGSNGRTYSIGFPVYRDINSGRQYGFVTAAHYLNVGNTIYNGTTSNAIGTVRLNKLGGPYDVSFVSLNSNTNCSNTISKTAYSLIPSNEEIDYPVYGKLVYLNASNHTNASGYINSTNFSLTTSLASHTGLIKASYTSSTSDSGGLVSSSGPNNYSRVQEGTHMGSYSGDGVFCSASNIVNLWYLTCY